MSKHWVSVTAINDEWDVQIDAIGDLAEPQCWRHRAWKDRDISAEWEAGRPPTGRYAAKKHEEWESCHYAKGSLDGPEDGELVVYGPKYQSVDCGEPSFSHWIVPGTAVATVPQ
ncbi:hypothetical protein [Bradyrhizobium sp. SZCCHNR3118]|uniref:hypothetical protein n=1 Tax=Bradyrhizobium sp. SZCCHNR3118 TaxID=3057468 RepID=UPI002915E66F|nr:hypothetical protein [Bradyrhizobium sp. SZCCHNR3118]